MDDDVLNITIIDKPHLYDLSQFRAQIVPNDVPFMFDHNLIINNKYAQHKLRVITYNYGEDYMEKYLMKGSGVFVERHEFIQAITPINNKCSDFVLLGRQNNDNIDLETGAINLQFIAIRVPFGYTLLIDSWAIHGDSTLIGLYMMAMTGDHHAMKTADTVFMKNKHTHQNVILNFRDDSIQSSGKDLYITSDEKSVEQLREDDLKLRQIIYSNAEKFWWQHVIDYKFPMFMSAIGFSETGSSKQLTALP